MHEPRLLSLADARETRWRNGRGQSRELAVWPGGASFERGDFDWRVALATVEEPGPFSPFEGYERWLVVVRGRGLAIAHGDAPARRVGPLEPYRFDGEEETVAEPLGGSVCDLGAIARRGVWRASGEALRLGARRWRGELGAGHALLHLVAGRATARATGEEEPFDLADGDTLWLAGLDGGEELELAGASDDAVAVLVLLEPE